MVNVYTNREKESKGNSVEEELKRVVCEGASKNVD